MHLLRRPSSKAAATKTWSPPARVKRGDWVATFELGSTVVLIAPPAANVAAPPRMQGRDFSPLYLEATPPAWRDEFYYEHAVVRDIDFIPSSEAVVRKEVKYLNWPDFRYEQLFDLSRRAPRQRRLWCRLIEMALLGGLRSNEIVVARSAATRQSSDHRSPRSLACFAALAHDDDLSLPNAPSSNGGKPSPCSA